MKRFLGLAGAVVVAVLVAGNPGPTGSTPPPASKIEAPPAAPGAAIEVAGRTRCPPGRKSVIAPVPLHTVEEVLVAPGDQVKKDQILVRLDDDEPKADVRAKKAAFDGAQIVLKESRRHHETLEKTFFEGALSLKAYKEAHATALKVEMDERAAKALWEAAKFELEHYEIKAQIDGVISWLDVHPGMVSRPGTTVWGEILDLREIDVRCEVTPEQADRIVVGQQAQVSWAGKLQETAKVVFVGISADKATGLVPVSVRMPNPRTRLRCEIPVRVRFTE